jgi:hypothetical protein
MTKPGQTGLAFVVWLTAASTLLASAPTYDCQCVSPASMSRCGQPLAQSCACGSACCVVKAENSKKKSCCREEDRGSEKRQVDRDFAAHFAAPQSGYCTRTAVSGLASALPGSYSFSNPESAAVLSTADLVSSPQLHVSRSHILASPGNLPVPDLVRTLQHILI